MQIKIHLFIIFLNSFFQESSQNDAQKEKNSGGETAFTRTEFALFTGSIFKNRSNRDNGAVRHTAAARLPQKWQTCKDSTEGGARTSRSAATATSK